VKKWLIIGGVVVVVALVALNLSKRGGNALEVETSPAALKDLVETVEASGTLTPKRKVDVSANTMGRVTRLSVAEGDRVEAGQLLLEIDPTEYASAVRGLEAGVRTAQANVELYEATLEKSRTDLDRAEQLFADDLSTQEQIDTARTNLRMEEARLASARAALLQARANLDRARYDLDKVTITAPMSGLVTRLNVEEGENAIMGTLNNPGTVLLTIADLSTMEAEVNVDETEVVRMALAQPVRIEIDAFPDTTFAGVVTEIGNSPIYTSTGQNQQAVDFKVTVTLTDVVAGVRPGLSAKATIDVARADQAVAVPIGAVVVREWPPRERVGRSRRPQTADRDSIDREDREGVFVVSEGEARFTPVVLGITGEEDFEIAGGLEGGETVVVGPFRVLRDLVHGDAVKAEKKRPGRDRDR
jgi:HlyD family secretion protein